MKSITKLMVVAMLLVAALVVAPVAAARTIATTGANAYVGEEDLSFAAVPAGETVIQWVHYSDPTAGTIDKTLTAASGVIDELNKGIPTGSYYVFTDASTADPADRTTAAGYVNVQTPQATLDVVLNTSHKDSVNGKAVTKSTVLDFRLGNNVDATVGAGINIDLTLPGGGVTNTFGGANLQRLATGTTEYVGGVDLSNAEAGTYTAVAKWAKATDFYDKGFNSNSVTFEVATKDLAITSNKDSIVRGNSFTVTITGESNEVYYLYVKDAGNLGDWTYPWMIAQNGVNFTTNVAPGVNVPLNSMANVTMTAAGTRTVQFDTDRSVKDQSFTIRVEEPKDPSKYDDVKVRIEAGSVTITASGTGTYYIGEEITLSGTNTEGDTVYLFMTGPNLYSKGTNILDPSERVVTGMGNSTQVNVETDDTWSRKWNTATLPLDAGSYTIYAVSADVDKDDLSNAKYNTASISLRSGFLTATTSGATVAKGDKLTISGVAQGNPDNVLIWIFGKNFYGVPNSRDLSVESVPVESDGTFEYELESGDTKDLAGGQYFVIVQHPMSSGTGSIGWNPNGFWDGATWVPVTTLQAPAAASAVINALDSPNIPDTYVKLTFVVDEPIISIDPIGTKEAGSKFTISGTTNLAVGGTLIVDVTSAAFQPGAKTEVSAFSGTGGSAIIEKGDGTNKWSFEVDATTFKPDQYIVKVESIEADKTATALFDMVEAIEKPTTPPAEVTTPPAGETTTPPAAETTTEPAPTPGFGALVALAGLGAVAFLVLRRK